MGAVKELYWEEISEDFLRRSEPKYDPQLVHEAQEWYRQFTGNTGIATVEEIVDLYVTLQNSIKNAN